MPPIKDNQTYKPINPIILEIPMSAFQIVVCGSFVPDPLQTLEPVSGPAGPSLKNEMMLPAILDPWAGHALFEAGNARFKLVNTPFIHDRLLL